MTASKQPSGNAGGAGEAGEAAGAMNMTVLGHLLGRLLQFTGRQGGTLGAAIESNPRFSAYLATAAGIVAWLGVSDDALTRIGQTLVALGRVFLQAAQQM